MSEELLSRPSFLRKDSLANGSIPTRKLAAIPYAAIVVHDRLLTCTAQRFNCKEHLAIVIMSSSASGAAYATEVLAAQKLYCKLLQMPRVSRDMIGDVQFVFRTSVSWKTTTNLLHQQIMSSPNPLSQYSYSSHHNYLVMAWPVFFAKAWFIRRECFGLRSYL